MSLAQRGRTEAEALDCAGSEVLHEHVGALEEPGEDRSGRRMLDVERDAFLGAIGPHEVRRLSLHRAVVTARRVACARPLDLDHTRTELGELPGGKWTGDDLLE